MNEVQVLIDKCRKHGQATLRVSPGVLNRFPTLIGVTNHD